MRDSHCAHTYIYTAISHTHHHQEELEAKNNQLVSLPRGIGQLAHLTLLSLTNNMLLAQPDEIGDLQALVELSLYSNRLTTLPDSLCRWDA